MHFVHRLRTIWSWLPSFRAVAETQHLPTAAQELGVVPSSLSRMVRQLEDELGIPLFDRTNKNLVLNDAGRRFLVAVREAMRIVDDALVSAIGDELRGGVGAVATGDLAHLVMIPAAATLAGSYPGLLMSTTIARADAAVAMLLVGDADAAVIAEPPPIHADLRAVELATWTRAVYGRTGRAADGPMRCVMVGTALEHVDDGWPVTAERAVVAWAPDERAALELCARGDLVTVAYDAAVTGYNLASQLTRIDQPEIAPRVLHLVSRRAVGRHRRTEVLVEAIRGAVART